MKANWGRAWIVALALGACFACTETKSDAGTKGNVRDEAAVLGYRAFAREETAKLVEETERFVRAIEASDTQKARELYAPTRMHFERIEPIAESLGEFDAKIDLREKDAEAATWSGFHVVEKILWTEGANEKAISAARTLLHDVKALNIAIGNAEITEKLMIAGSVELLNEVSTSKVTGEEEVYSRTDLWDIVANVEGSRKAFDLLKKSLEKVDGTNVALVTERFDALQTLLEAQKTKSGYRYYNELSPETIREFVQAIDALAEPLAYLALGL